MADLSRNRWPVIFGTGGRNPSEQVAEFIGIGRNCGISRKTPYSLEMHVARSLSADVMNPDTSNLLVKIKGQKNL